MIVEVVHHTDKLDEYATGAEVQTRHWARIKGDNGEIVWTTEQYAAAETAHDAIDLLAAGFSGVTAAGRAEDAPFQVREVWE